MGANLRKKGELSKNILTLLRFCTNLNKISMKKGRTFQKYINFITILHKFEQNFDGLSDVFCNFVTS